MPSPLRADGPPFPLTTPITFFTLLAGFGFSRIDPGPAFLDAQSAEHEPQFPLQVSGA